MSDGERFLSEPIPAPGEHSPVVGVSSFERSGRGCGCARERLQLSSRGFRYHECGGAVVFAAVRVEVSSAIERCAQRARVAARAAGYRPGVGRGVVSRESPRSGALPFEG